MNSISSELLHADEENDLMGYGEDDSMHYCSRFTNHSIQHFSIIRLSSFSCPSLTHMFYAFTLYLAY